MCNRVCVSASSIQQLHYEMANNLMKAAELKLKKTYIAGEKQGKRRRTEVRPQAAEEDR